MFYHCNSQPKIVNAYNIHSHLFDKTAAYTRGFSHKLATINTHIFVCYIIRKNKGRPFRLPLATVISIIPYMI